MPLGSHHPRHAAVDVDGGAGDVGARIRGEEAREIGEFLRPSGPAERESANSRIDPDNRLLWKFPLRRLEAEPIRDALLVVAGRLDLSVGGKSFEDGKAGSNRRAANMARISGLHECHAGFSSDL